MVEPARLLTDADKQSIVQEAEQLPVHLYQYRSLRGEQDRDRARSAIVDRTLWFSSPTDFNDPFDCQPRLTFKATREEVRAFWRRFLRNRGLHNRPEHVSRAEALANAVGDPAAEQRLQETFVTSIAKNGLLCTSPTPTNVLLWSHYGDQHRGVCLRFRVDRLVAADWDCVPIPVRYSEDYPSLDAHLASQGDLLTLGIQTKARDWSYEKEWRLLLPGRTGLEVIPEGILDGVVLGLRTTKELSEAVQTWVLESRREIEVTRVEAVPGSFQLVERPTPAPALDAPTGSTDPRDVSSRS